MDLLEGIMKNFMVIDGAANGTLDVFGVDEATFAIAFPNGEDIAFLDEVEIRARKSGVDEVEFFRRLYLNRQDKKSINGLHGILHSTGSPCDRSHFPTRREKDVRGEGRD
jgi:hypothetical protein